MHIQPQRPWNWNSSYFYSVHLSSSTGPVLQRVNCALRQYSLHWRGSLEPLLDPKDSDHPKKYGRNNFVRPYLQNVTWKPSKGDNRILKVLDLLHMTGLQGKYTLLHEVGWPNRNVPRLNLRRSQRQPRGAKPKSQRSQWTWEAALRISDLKCLQWLGWWLPSRAKENSGYEVRWCFQLGKVTTSPGFQSSWPTTHAFLLYTSGFAPFHRLEKRFAEEQRRFVHALPITWEGDPV